MRRRSANWIGSGSWWFLGVYFGSQVLLLVVAMLFNLDWWSAWNGAEEVELRTRCKHIILLVGCGLFGLWRMARSPAANPAYLAWLRRSPWRYGLPLPLGPLHLVWTDAVKLGVLAAIAWYDAGLHPLWPVVVFAIAYLFAALRTLSPAAKPAAAALGFGFGGLLLAWPDVVAMSEVAAGMYVVCVLGMIHYLKTIPWENADPAALRGRGLAALSGWPMGTLGPARKFESLTYTAAATTAAVIGWWFYCVASWVSDPTEGAVAIAVGIVGLMSLFRLMKYMRECQDSMPIFARIGARRLIVPRHDYAVLTPAAAFVAALAIGVPGAMRHVPGPVCGGLACGVGVLIVLGGGPSLRHWYLTSECRMGRLVTSPANARRYTGST